MDQNQDQPLGLSCLHKLKSLHHSVMMIFAPSLTDVMLYVSLLLMASMSKGTKRVRMAVSIQKVHMTLD